MFNAHGDVVQAGNTHYTYDAFGNEQNASPTDANIFRYCGEYWDKETTTYYLRARYYAPRTGRFVTEDPIRDGLNWYTYCGNNPIRYIDPSGNSLLNINKAMKDSSAPINMFLKALQEGFNRRQKILSVSMYNAMQPYSIIDGTEQRTPEELTAMQEWADVGSFVMLSYMDSKMLEGALKSGARVHSYNLAKADAASPYGKPRPEAVWDSWNNYEKVTVNGKTYARVGDTLYSHHAVDRLQPSGMRYSSYGKPAGSAIYQAGGVQGRSIAPGYVNYVLDSSSPLYQAKSGNFLYKNGNIQVVTNKYGMVVTVEYIS